MAPSSASAPASQAHHGVDVRRCFMNAGCLDAYPFLGLELRGKVPRPTIGCNDCAERYMAKPTGRTSTQRAPAAPIARKSASLRAPRKPQTPKPRAAAKPVAADVRITHPERVVFPGSTITKGDVAAYYLAVMRWLLPELAGRPLSIIRCPD